MSFVVTADMLSPFLAADPDTVDKVWRRLQSGEEVIYTLEILRLSSTPASPVEAMLSELVNRDGLGKLFMVVLEAEIPVPQDQPAVPVPEHPRSDADIAGFPLFPEVSGVNFDPDDLGDFTKKCQNFRCRVFVNNRFAGTGAFVSPRLVLTSWHVVGKADSDTIDPLAKIEIITADKERYVASVAFENPCHKDEWTIGVNDLNLLEGFSDVALLRISRPVGHNLGKISLPGEAREWTGWRRIVLVHYPDGMDKGVSFAEVLDIGTHETRLIHTAPTLPGSSGGPGFDNSFKLVGLHQGKMNDRRRLVPFSAFSGIKAFRNEIAQDLTPQYLWSLDGSLDSHFVIAREVYFDALHEILTGRAPNLKGLWIRRLFDDGEQTGLGFSYDLLVAFLNWHNKTPDPLRVQLDLGISDLFTEIAALALPSAGATLIAGAGVRRDETTPEANDADRARILVRQIAAEIGSETEKGWIYFDNPPGGVSQYVQMQFEHLVTALLAEPNLHFVIAGAETYTIPEPVFRRVEAAVSSPKPCILTEYLGEFQREDVVRTVNAMCKAMGLNWSADVVDEMVRRALAGLATVGNRYRDSQLKAVATRLRDEANRSLVA